MKKQKGNRGFFTLIIIIIVAVLALSFFGFNPQTVWTNYALPVIQFIWQAVVTILGFIVSIGVQLANQLGIGN